MTATVTTRSIPGADVVVGDAVVLLGEEHRISRFEPYEHPTGPDDARIAYDATGWAMVIFDDFPVDVAA